MANAEMWRGPGESPCVCENCTGFPNAELYFGVGELCIVCGSTPLVVDAVFEEWLNCTTCRLSVRRDPIEVPFEFVDVGDGQIS